MNINRELLEQATKKHILSQTQADELWAFCQTQNASVPSFNFTQVLYYFGGLLAIAAMTLFITLAWDKLGGIGILLLALLYAGIGIALTHYLFSKQLMIPAGITATFAVACIPLAIYGFQKAMGWWPENYHYQDYHRWIDGLWIYMELGTLMGAAIIFYIYRRPFLLFPVAITLWYMSMDVAAFIINNHASDLFQIRQFVTLYMGILTLLFAFWVDIRTKSKLDYAFHLYLWGTIMFWGALTSMSSDSEWNKFFYCCINLGMIGLSVILSRRVLAVFGGIGVTLYLGHLSYNLFKDSLLFPVALTILGFIIIFLGIYWNKHGERISQKLRSHLPKICQELIDKRHSS